jgi:hypothetical protein
MARAELEDRWVADGDPEKVRRRVLRFLDECGMQVVEEDEDYVRVWQGSHLWTRLFGAWFVGPNTLPKKATITFRPADGGVRVSALIEEAWGFGIFDPITRDRYVAFFEKWLDDLMDATGVRR